VWDSELIATGFFIPAGEAGAFFIAMDEEEERFFLPPTDYEASYAYDIVQTESLPGRENDVPNDPEIPVPPLMGHDARDPYDVLLQVAEAEGITVDTRDEDHGDLLGFYNSGRRFIWVRPRTALGTVHTLAHELGHHFYYRLSRNPHEDRTPESQREVEAEGAAAVVLHAFGLDSSEQSVPYIAEYWDAMKPEAHTSALVGIQRTAQAIIERARQVALEGIPLSRTGGPLPSSDERVPA